MRTLVRRRNKRSSMYRTLQHECPTQVNKILPAQTDTTEKSFSEKEFDAEYEAFVAKMKADRAERLSNEETVVEKTPEEQTDVTVTETKKDEPVAVETVKTKKNRKKKTVTE